MGQPFSRLSHFDLISILLGRFSMRLDKFLKVSRLIKRRTVANEACDAGRVFINDKPAKASTNVKVGDVLTIRFGDKDVKVEILDVQETVKKDEAKELFKYI
jgi:ribosomal 50S subunit-recycling heat shock protein